MYLGVELLGYMLIRGRIFKRTAITLFHIPTSNVWGFVSPHPLQHLVFSGFFFFFFTIIVITVTVILSGYEMINHCGYYLHSLITNDVGHWYIFFGKVCSFIPFFIELSFCYSVERVLDTFWTLDPYEITDLQIFFPIIVVVFPWWCLLMHDIAFNFGQV